MKRLIGILFLAGFISCLNSGDHPEKPPQVNRPAMDKEGVEAPILEFDETEHHFGRVYEGEQVGWFFRFRNKGKKDLLILNAFSSCGCTVPDYNKKPVRPGEEGMIKVVFDSNGRSGTQTKTVTIESNARNKIVTLNVTAEIIKK
jgi:hypothetical protein